MEAYTKLNPLDGEDTTFQAFYLDVIVYLFNMFQTELV